MTTNLPKNRERKWVVPAGGRVAHFCFDDSANGYIRLTSTCGRVMLVPYFDDDPAAKYCKQCEWRRAGGDSAGGESGGG